MAANTKEKILEVALDAFSEVGFEGTTTREICKRADVNVAAINYHWGSKEKLWLAACRWAAERLLSVVQTNLAQGGTTRETIERILGACFDLLSEDPRPIRIITWASLQSESIDFTESAGNVQPFVRFAMQYIGQLVEKGEIADIDYEMVLATFWGQYLVAFIDMPGQRVFFGKDLSDKELNERFRRTLIRSALTILGLEKAELKKKAG